jgi:hypothetical protein
MHIFSTALNDSEIYFPGLFQETQHCFNADLKSILL